MSVFDCATDDGRAEGIAAAQGAIAAGELVVMPTDTVYGIAADAFTPDAVTALLDAKGRGRDMPPPVLIGSPAVLRALAADVPPAVEDLVEAFWPGPLTVILTAQPSLNWDLGETRGTVALRMPEDPVALELLRATGPLAVSSANRSGNPAATAVMDAAVQLGDRVSVYLDAGPSTIGESSTIIDATVTPPEIVRAGALTAEDIVERIGDIFAAPESEAPAGDAPADDAPTEDAPAGNVPAEDAPIEDATATSEDPIAGGEPTPDNRTPGGDGGSEDQDAVARGGAGRDAAGRDMGGRDPGPR